MNILNKSLIINSEESKKEEYSNYPTKEEFEKKIRQINEKELKSDRFKTTKEFVLSLDIGKNIILEKKLFKIIGTYGLEDNLINKDYYYKMKSRAKRYIELKEFIDSLTMEQIYLNQFLKVTVELMETSFIDCKIIIDKLQEQIKNLEISNQNTRFDMIIDIPKERLYLLPLSIHEFISIPSYIPNDYKKEVYLLDERNRYVYKRYNAYVKKVIKMAEDIYQLQMWNLLSAYPEQVDNYYFQIINTHYERKFMMSFFVKKNRKKFIQKKTELYQLSEQKKNIISKIIGLSFDEIIRMNFDDLEKYSEQKISKRSTYYLNIDKIIDGSEFILKTKKKFKNK